MREVKRTLMQANCSCKKPQVLLEVNLSFNYEHLQLFIDNGFTISKSYIDAGILYIENTNLAAVGPFGSNRLQIKCKNSNCDTSLADLERILTNIP